MTLLRKFSCVALLNMRKRALVFSAIFAVILMAGAGVSIATMMQATPTLRLQYRVADPTSPNDNQSKDCCSPLQLPSAEMWRGRASARSSRSP